ncbi:MAG: SRPBCC family protein [Candidatus Zixiibacteriota bacterium]|nr:MAG: SRPBCC family protein [candidate division Zixibacteria bacterium]
MKTDEKNKIDSSITIEKKPPEIWNTLVEFSNYRSWNPVVSHAAIYGSVVTGTAIKIMSGKWDFRFSIVHASPPERLDVEGGAVGLNMKLRLNISPLENGSSVSIEALAGGWITKIFSKKIKRNIEESLELFLSALERRISGGNSYEITRHDEKATNEDDRRGFSMPTPFNLIYKTRQKKSPRRRSFLR